METSWPSQSARSLLFRTRRAAAGQVRRPDRDSRGHRLDEHDSETLPSARRGAEDVGGSVVARKILVAHASLEMDAPLEGAVGHPFDPPPQTAVPHDDEAKG